MSVFSSSSGASEFTNLNFAELLAVVIAICSFDATSDAPQVAPAKRLSALSCGVCWHLYCIVNLGAAESTNSAFDDQFSAHCIAWGACRERSVFSAVLVELLRSASTYAA